MNAPALLALTMAMLLAGCASSQCRPVLEDAKVTPTLAHEGRLEEGRRVRWGGQLVHARNLADRTELEVLGYPLDGCGRPQITAEPIGRFILLYRGYLETADLERGRRITATGRYTGLRAGRVGDAPYRFPILESFHPDILPSEPDPLVYPRPWISIGIGAGSWGSGGGVGVIF